MITIIHDGRPGQGYTVSRACGAGQIDPSFLADGSGLSGLLPGAPSVDAARSGAAFLVPVHSTPAAPSRWSLGLCSALRSCMLSAVALTAMVARLPAQLPTARLDSAFPPGVRAGMETEVTISGQDLDGADRLLFSDAGLSATPVDSTKFKVTASAGMAPGIYEVRAAGKHGISSGWSFTVGLLPECNEPGDNASAEKAFVVTPPVTINGTAGGEAADYYRFHAAKDQPLMISCAAGRIDSPLNAVIAILDSAGRELATAHRTRQAEAVLTFTAPADGDYIVRVNDMTWQAGIYRLSIASPAEIGTADPVALPLAGALCDAASSLPGTTIDSPAANAATAHKLTLPVVIACGDSAGDWFEFTGSKGRTVMIDVLSHRLGEPSDFVLQVDKVTRDEKGQEKSERIAQWDDTAAPPGAEVLQMGGRDPSGSLTCEEGVIYRLHAVDRFRAGRPWRLVLRDPQPGFSLVSFCVSPVTRGASVQRWSSFLRKGGSALVKVAVLRHDGFDAPVTVRMTDLPPGVLANEVTLPPGVDVASLVVRAGPDAKDWSGRIRITGTSGEVTVEAHEAVPRWSVGNTGAERLAMRLTRDGPVLAVTEAEASPLGIEATGPATYETALGGSLEVPVKFLRDASLKGFKGEWEAVLMGLPGLRQAPVVKPPGDATEAKLVLNVLNKDGNQFLPGTWAMHASARGTIQWKPDESGPQKELLEEAWSAPISIKIEPSPVLLGVPASVTVAPGGQVDVPLKIERRYGFAEALTVEAGAPGLTVEKLSIAKEAAEAVLVIRAAADAAPGARDCELKAKLSWNGQEIPWSVKLNVKVKP